MHILKSSFTLFLMGLRSFNVRHDRACLKYIKLISGERMENLENSERLLNIKT